MPLVFVLFLHARLSAMPSILKDFFKLESGKVFLSNLLAVCIPSSCPVIIPPAGRECIISLRMHSRFEGRVGRGEAPRKMVYVRVHKLLNKTRKRKESLTDEQTLLLRFKRSYGEWMLAANS